MKKIIFFALISFALSMSSAVAQTTFTNTGTSGTAVNELLSQYRTSAQVTLIAVGNTASYNAVSGHQQGTDMFGSSGGDSIIYKATKVAGDPVVVGNVPAIPATASDTSGFADDTDWKAL